MATKKVASPTGKPSKKRDEIKEFEKSGTAKGGKKTSSYSAPKKAEAKKTSSSSRSRKPTPGMLGSGAAAKAGRTLQGRGKAIDKAVKKAGG